MHSVGAGRCPLGPAELGRRYAAVALDMAGAVTRPDGPAAS